MNKDKLIKILIPVVAVLIIVESIILVSVLNKDKKTKDSDTTQTEKVEQIIPVVDLKLVSDVTEMKVGKSYKVSLNLIPRQEIKLDALELYIKFDPALLTISNLVSSKDMVKANLMKVSDKKDVIVSNFLFTEKDGVVFTSKEVSVLTFSVTPKKSGVYSLEISTGDKNGDSITMLVDEVTNQALPFSSNKLEIKLLD
jgi:hypothetical protein